MQPPTGRFYQRAQTRYCRSMASRYEIKFSDAARADFDRLQAEAESCAESSSDALRQLLEVHALLDQIAEGDPAEDDFAEPYQRYLSEGGMYMYFQRQEESRIATITSFREGPAGAPK